MVRKVFFRAKRVGRGAISAYKDDVVDEKSVFSYQKGAFAGAGGKAPT